MKFTKSKDGVRRATVRVEHRVSVEDLVLAALFVGEDIMRKDGVDAGEAVQRISPSRIHRMLRWGLADGGRSWQEWGHERLDTSIRKDLEKAHIEAAVLALYEDQVGA